MAAPRFAVRSVAIIGAGSSGLTAARYIQGQGVYDRIVVYEQRSEVGGIWNYSPRPTDQEHIPQESPYLRPDAPLQPQPHASKANGTNAHANGHGAESEAPEFPTPTYDELYVNIPHPLMGFTDLAILAVHEANHPGQSLPIFPHRQTIEEYLIGYSQEVRHLIRFSTKVDDVHFLRRPRQRHANGTTNGTSNGVSNGTSNGNNEVNGVNGVNGVHGGEQNGAPNGRSNGFHKGEHTPNGVNGTTNRTTNGATDDYVDSWEVHAISTRDGSPSVETFDAVIVCQGHYDITFTPAIANIEAFNDAHPGVLTHSKRYRNPGPFRGKKVVVVGNAASGLDIASQIKAAAQVPLYLSVHTPTASEGLKRLTGAEEVPEILEFLVEERGVRLADGRVLRDLDAVIFCTGYLFALPFLEKTKPKDSQINGLGSMLSTGRRIHRLYDDLFHIDHPTLAFLCLPMKVVPYPLAQAQAAILSRVWANTLDLPSTEEMNAWEREAEKVRGPTFHVWPQGDDGVYINAAYKRIMENPQNPASRTGKEPPRWDNHLVWMRTVALQAKIKFEETGQTATSVEELGFVYEEGSGEPAQAAATYSGA